MFIIYLLHFCIQPFLSLLHMYNFNTYKESVAHWSNNIMNTWYSTMYRTSKQKVIHNKNIIYFANHRSWADFIYDHVTTDYSSKFISRIAVFLVLPFIGIVGLFTNTLYFFSRSSKNIKKMFDGIYKSTKNDTNINLLVYPEGTRRGDAIDPIDLKKGFIYYAFDHDYDIQFIISKNKEKVFNEKKFIVNHDQNVYVYYSKAYSPSKFKKNNNSEEEEEEKQKLAFYNYINMKWKKEWNIVYHTKSHEKLIKPIKIDTTYIWNNNNKIPLWHKISIYSITISILFISLYFLF